MRPQSRKSYHHGDLRNALLQAALELVQETGSTHFSLRDVTERIGVSQPAFYRHFPDLDDLLSTLCRNGFDAFGEMERQMMADSSNPWLRLRALVRAYIRFAVSNPGYFRIMFDSGLANRPENLARAQPTYHRGAAGVGRSRLRSGHSSLGHDARPVGFDVKRSARRRAAQAGSRRPPGSGRSAADRAQPEEVSQAAADLTGRSLSTSPLSMSGNLMPGEAALCREEGGF
jgi:AcrR family transcriptional regulator